MLSMSPEEVVEQARKGADARDIVENFVSIGRQLGEGGQHLFACRHFKGGQCAIHETKPRMCRDYPYDRPCKIPGCTWSEVSTLLLPAPAVNGKPET